MPLQAFDSLVRRLKNGLRVITILFKFPLTSICLIRQKYKFILVFCPMSKSKKQIGANKNSFPPDTTYA